MEAILVVGATRDRDTLEKLYAIAVETFNLHLGQKKVWIVLDGIAIQIFSGDSFKRVSERYGKIVDNVKKG